MLTTSIEDRFDYLCVEDRKTLIVTHNGKVIQEVPDAYGGYKPPFLRTIKEWIDWAYKKGLEDAEKENTRRIEPVGD